MTALRGWSGLWSGLGLVFLALAVLCFVRGVPSLGLGVNLGLGVIWIGIGCYCVMKAAPLKAPE